MLGMRPLQGTDKRYYHPERDVAHLFPVAYRHVVRRLSADAMWAPLDKIRRESELTGEDLGRALADLATFINSATDFAGESMEECLARSHYLAAPPAAQVLIAAEIGLYTLGLYFGGVNSAAYDGQDPAHACKGLLAEASRTYKLLRLPRWRRRLLGIWRRIRGAYRELRGRGRPQRYI